MNQQPNNQWNCPEQTTQSLSTPIHSATSKQAVTQQPTKRMQKTHQSINASIFSPTMRTKAKMPTQTKYQINQQTQLISSQNEINLQKPRIVNGSHHCTCRFDRRACRLAFCLLSFSFCVWRVPTCTPTKQEEDSATSAYACVDPQPLHCHNVTWKRPILVRNLKPLSFSFFSALTCERIFIKTHSIESRWVRGPEHILFTGASVNLSNRTFYRLGQCRG